MCCENHVSLSVRSPMFYRHFSNPGYTGCTMDTTGATTQGHVRDQGSTQPISSSVTTPGRLELHALSLDLFPWMDIRAAHAALVDAMTMVSACQRRSFSKARPRFTYEWSLDRHVIRTSRYVQSLPVAPRSHMENVEHSSRSLSIMFLID
jgi:hypothetical protein